jgi:hypothetical protein
MEMQMLILVVGLVVLVSVLIGLTTYLLLARVRSRRVDVELRPVPSWPADLSKEEMAGLREQHCSMCRRFDLHEGQAFLQSFPVAAQVYRWVSPRDEARAAPDLVPLKAQWQDFGACDRHNTVVWGGMVPAQRLAMKTKTKQNEAGEEIVVAHPLCADGIDCWEGKAVT